LPWSFPSPICVFVKLSIRRDRYTDFKTAARAVSLAYQQHADRLEWTAYATVAGGSLNIYILIPLRTIGDMDRIVSLDHVMADVYGAEGAATLAKFQDCVLDMNTMVLNRIEPAPDLEPVHSEPAEYLFYAELKVDLTKVKHLREGLGHLATLIPGAPLSLYGPFAGSTRIHCFATGHRIGDLEAVGRLFGQIASGYGDEADEQILAGLTNALVETETSILHHIGHQGPQVG
jgi:hypothetical protein